MKRSLFMALSLVLFVVGLAVMLGSVRWGAAAANTYLVSQGGGMDSAQFMVILQEYIEMYRWLGGILSLTGGFGLVRSVETV
jgi:hypothetical protein